MLKGVRGLLELAGGGKWSRGLLRRSSAEAALPSSLEVMLAGSLGFLSFPAEAPPFHSLPGSSQPGLTPPAALSCNRQRGKAKGRQGRGRQKKEKRQNKTDPPNLTQTAATLPYSGAVGHGTGEWGRRGKEGLSSPSWTAKGLQSCPGKRWPRRFFPTLFSSWLCSSQLLF